MSYTLVLEWMPGDLYMSAVTARCTAPTSSYSVVWLPPNKVYQITLYCGSTSLVSFLVGAFRGKAWSYMSKRIIALVLCAGMLLLGGCASHDEAGAGSGDASETNGGQAVNSPSTTEQAQPADTRTSFEKLFDEGPLPGQDPDG